MAVLGNCVIMTSNVKKDEQTSSVVIVTSF